MRKRPTKQDSELVKQLNRVSDEGEMRKARLWWRDEFWPASAQDYLQIEKALATRKSRWLRQVTSYWGMAASLVLDKTLGEMAFLDPKLSAEMFTVFSKVRPFLKELRAQTQNPDFMANVEKVIGRSKSARVRLQNESRRLAAIRAQRQRKH
jgi:hypothetical protein